MFSYTNWMIENAFQMIDKEKELLMQCETEDEEKICRGIIKQYNDFLNRILVK